MLSTHQSILPKHSPLPMSSPHSYTVMQFRSTPNEDEDDICPVCESECTCGNASTQSLTSQTPTSSAPAVLSLKIKLPPLKPLSSASKPTPAKRARPKSNRQKQTTAGSATVGGTTNNNGFSRRLGPFSAPGHQLGDPLPVDSTADILRDASPLTPEPELEPPLRARGNRKRPTKTATPKDRKRVLAAPAKTKQRAGALPKQTSAVSARKRKTMDTAWTFMSPRRRRRAQAVLRARSNDSDNDFSEDDGPFLNRIRSDSDGESVQFPTFISVISTTSGNDNDSPSMTSDSFDSDCSVRAEEENMILAEERAKLRREILNNEETWHMEKRKWDHLKNSNNWEIRPRKKSVGAGETESEVESDSDSEAQGKEDEEEAEDDDDPDIRYGRGMVTGWHSDDDDFDAELFFATLADSSGPGSDADAEDEEFDDDQSDANSDLSTISITEAAAARLLSPHSGTSCPLVVTEDWDGRLVFAHGLKDGQGVLDLHFEVNSAQRYSNLCEAMQVPLDGAGDVPERVNDNEDLISDESGDTTDDLLDHQTGISTPQGVLPLSFRCPTPPVTSIDPLSTLSPISGPRNNRFLRNAPTPSPKPADILASAEKVLRECSTDKNTNHSEHSASASVASPPETSTSMHSRQTPFMGSFKRISGDPKQSAIIDGSKTIVYSPFSCNRRVHKAAERGRKRTAAGCDIFPYTSKRVRQSSLPDSNRGLVSIEVVESRCPLVQSSPELPLPTTPIDLNDVLDTAFLDSDDADEAAKNTSGERYLRHLSRWDRVPVGTFRRSRTAYMDENSVCVPTLARSNDGVSYGSAGGHVLRKSPLGAALWQTNSGKTLGQPPNTVSVSPVIFPQRDGERTPTSQFPDTLQKPLPSDAGPSKSRKQKRKEKKKLHTSAPKVTSQEFYHVTANVPPLNL